MRIILILAVLALGGCGSPQPRYGYAPPPLVFQPWQPPPPATLYGGNVVACNTAYGTTICSR